ncbi:hypothetical protein B0H10DRAFT_2083359, partial [Mycena sp. CBHHK59/15]
LSRSLLLLALSILLTTERLTRWPWTTTLLRSSGLRRRPKTPPTRLMSPLRPTYIQEEAHFLQRQHVQINVPPLNQTRHLPFSKCSAQPARTITCRRPTHSLTTIIPAQLAPPTRRKHIFRR